MSSTLYRKYRPSKFGQVISQNHIKVTLQNEIEMGKIAHAYLFAGPRGIGKTTIARILAKALNCPNRTQASEPCGECVSCLEISEGRALDLVEIDAASNRGINEIRELKEQTKYTPIKSKFKVFIIDEVHMLTSEAFNALLKTLEEPPSYAVFILATTEAHKLPETIISRCQRFDFKKVPFSDIVAHLDKVCASEGIVVEKKVLENVARISEGYLRDALSLLGQIMALGEKNISEEQAAIVLPRSDWQKVLEMLSFMFNCQTRQALRLVNELAESGADLEHLTGLLLETARKILLGKVIGDWQEFYWEFAQEQASSISRTVSEKISANELVKIIEILMATSLDYKNARILQLPLELAIIKITELLGEAQKSNPIGHEPGQGKGAGFSNNESNEQATTENQTPENVMESAMSEPENFADSPNNALGFEEISLKWPEVIEALKEHNYSLSASLKLGKPLRCEAGNVVLGFKYRFHYERLKEKNNLEKIREVLQRVYQAPLSIAGEIDDRHEAEDFINGGQKGANVIKEALEVLGGEVVG